MPESFKSGDQATPNQDPSGQGTSFTGVPGDLQLTPNDGGNQMAPEDVSALVKKSEHAQNHIQTLEQENAQFKTQLADMQDKLKTAVSVEELLQGQKEVQDIDVDALTASVAAKVSGDLASQQATKVADDNWSTVTESLTKAFGDKTDEMVKKACMENDMSWDDMIEVAKKNPRLALKLCEVKVDHSATPSPTSSINTQALPGSLQPQEPTKVNVMDLRTDSARVTDLYRRFDEFNKQNAT